MGKHQTHKVLKKVFQDITNITEIIDTSKKIEKSCKSTNFNDKVEAGVVIEKTKDIIERLKGDVSKISTYFDENYTLWKSKDNIVNNDTVTLANGDSCIDTDDQSRHSTTSEFLVDTCNTESNSTTVDDSCNTKSNKDCANETNNLNESVDTEELVDNNKETNNDREDSTDKDDCSDIQKENVSAELLDTPIANKHCNVKNKMKHKSKKDRTKDVDVSNSSNKSSVDTESDNESLITKENKNGNIVTEKSKDTELENDEEKDTDHEKEKDTDDEKEKDTDDEKEKDTDVDKVNDTVIEKENDTSTEKETDIDDDDEDTDREKEKDKHVRKKKDTSGLEKDIEVQKDESVEKEIEKDTVPETKKGCKVFLKCIDISKLQTVPDTENDSVLIISDSEPENDCPSILNQTRKQKSNTNLDNFGIGQEITISKINKSSKNCKDNDVQILNKHSSEENNGHHKSVDTSSENKVADKKSSKTKKNQVIDLLKIKGTINLDSSSDSDNVDKDKQLERVVRKLPKRTKLERHAINTQNDKKIGYNAYVPLPRYPCEQLKTLYLRKLENDELNRLTDVSNLKKRKRDRDKESDSSESEKEKPKPKMKRKRRTSKDSNTSVSDVDSCDTIPPEKRLDSNEVNVDPATIILNDVDSATDLSSTEAEQKKKKSKEKKKSCSDQSSSDDEKKSKSKDSSDSDNKKKKKWRDDKLLKKKVIDSDTDSEDEFAKFKRQREKTKREVKKRIKSKVIDSDSSSSGSTKKKNRKKSESSDKPSSSSSSSSSSESEESDDKNKKDTNTKKGRGRIKRVKDSSEDDDNDKSTRKTIRKVIGHDSLQEATKEAEKEEKERKARIAERQKKYNAIFNADQLEDATVETVVLDFDEASKKELVSVNKNLVSKLKPHQAKGIQFMWNACYESLERIKSTNGSGCILAHCMGLGKTFQVITLVHTLITHEEKTNVKKVMVVCPVNTVLNWVDEFKKWLTSDVDDTEIEVYELVSNKQVSYREHLVELWSKHGGVLIIGYDMFRNLTNPTNKRIRKRAREIFQSGMVNPGPDLIICDEGHLLKNEKTNLSVAISRVRTERRIVLTGTPMQNNMKEYYCMVQFVKPNLLGTFKEYLNRFVNPITNGQYTDSTPHDISIMKKRSHVLHKMLDGIVQRKDYEVLAPYLPPKNEYVLFTKLSEIQIKLYQYYLDHYARRPVDAKLRKTAFLFSDFQELQRICTHPRVLLLKAIENRNKAMFADSEDDSEGSIKNFLDDEDSGKSSGSSSSSSSSGSDSDNSSKKKNEQGSKSGARLTRNSAAAAGIDVGSELQAQLAETNHWYKEIIKDDEELENIAIGGKLYLLFEIIQQCELIGDKILIFSQSLYSLNIIEYFLAKVDEATQDGKNETVCGFSGSWAPGLDYFRIDGQSSCDNRAAWCKSFNNPDNTRARLFLISTKAGGLGINLIGANRVVIFDVSWNPSHDTQSIYRVYRFGQTKPCYIYRFVTWGTMEMKIYERQVTKQAISKRIIDEQQIDRHYNQNDLAELYNFDPTPSEAPTPLLPKDVLLAELLQKEKERIYKYHEHQSLLENKEDEELNEAERKAAWEEYEHEKTNPPVVNNVAGSAGGNAGWVGNLPLISINAALSNILQRDNPTWTREQVYAVIPLVVQQLKEQLDKGETLLYNRIVGELKIIQIQQQHKLQQYYAQQQMRIVQQNVGAPVQKVAPINIQNYLSNKRLTSRRMPINPDEVVELND